MPSEDSIRTSRLFASMWTTFSVATILLVTRFYVRFIRDRIGADDWCMLVGWVFYCIASALSTAELVRGSVKHIYDITPENVEYILLITQVASLFGAWAAAISKTAVALLIPRIMVSRRSWQSYFLAGNITIYMLVTTVSTILVFTQCTPARALWQPQLVSTGQAACPRVQINLDITFLQSAFGAYMDFMLATLPVTFIYQLKVPVWKRVIFCLLLSLGVIAGVFAIIKTIQFQHAFASADPTYNSYNVFLFASLEIPFVIIAGSIPPAKPLWDMIFHGKSIDGRGTTSFPGIVSWMRTTWQSLSSISSSHRNIASSDNNHNQFQDSLEGGPTDMETPKDHEAVLVAKDITVHYTRADPNFESFVQDGLTRQTK